MWKLNVNHHSDEVVNKTIKNDVSKHSAKCAGDNLDKSTELIFDNSEEKIKATNIKNSKVDARNQRESEVINNNIFERMEISEVYTDSQCSKNVEFSISIFDIFNEVRIKGDDSWLFRLLSLSAFG